MYTYNDDDTCYEINYCKICKQRWSMKKFEKIDGNWVENKRFFKRFDSLEDARIYAISHLKFKKEV